MGNFHVFQLFLKGRYEKLFLVGDGRGSFACPVDADFSQPKESGESGIKRASSNAAAITNLETPLLLWKAPRTISAAKAAAIAECRKAIKTNCEKPWPFARGERENTG